MPGQLGMHLSLGSDRAVPPLTALRFVLQCWRKASASGGLSFCAVSEGPRRSAGKPTWQRAGHGKNDSRSW